MRSPFIDSKPRSKRLFWPLLCLSFALGYSILFGVAARMAEESWHEEVRAGQSDRAFREMRREILWQQINNYLMEREIRKLRQQVGNPRKM